jgi:pimeloyl-[acyl-carrier protein] methyl ester esterase
MDGSVFSGQMERLSPQFRCIAPDLPAHGQSRNLPPNIPRSAEALNKLILDLKLEDVILVGWSMGALIAWRYLSRFGQDKVSGLVTVDMSPKISNGPEWSYGLLRETRREAADPTYKTDWEKRASAIARGMFSGAASDNDKSVDAALELVLSQNPGMMQAMWASMMKTDERATIPQLRIPWLICYGMHSQIYPRQVRKWMLQRAPQARALGFSASGHSPHLEEPATFAQALVRFADGLPTTTSSSQALGRAM